MYKIPKVYTAVTKLLKLSHHCEIKKIMIKTQPERQLTDIGEIDVSVKKQQWSQSPAHIRSSNRIAQSFWESLSRKKKKRGEGKLKKLEPYFGKNERTG